jgi:hypothetical protein
MNDDSEEIPRIYWILLLVTGAILFIIQTFIAFRPPSLPGN